MAKKVIVIPTYNERNNIVVLLEKIFSLPIDDLHVLVVDDNSPDGTGNEVERLRGVYPRLQILHRTEKSGLGRAYVAGFQRVLAEEAELILQMDADLSHNPEYLPAMINGAATHDLVLGSRYIQGGGVANWNWLRRQISRFGNQYARTVLGVAVRDLTGGFKCYRRAVLEQIGLESLSSVGYNFQIETTYETLKKGFSVLEVPIVFTERTEGKSKFDSKIMLESFWKVLKLRFKR